MPASVEEPRITASMPASSYQGQKVVIPPMKFGSQAPVTSTPSVQGQDQGPAKEDPAPTFGGA
eukprot:7771826-Prorocentrum_lima.AAC.1